MQRRRSARIQNNQEKEKELLVQQKVELFRETGGQDEEQEGKRRKKADVFTRRENVNVENVSPAVEVGKKPADDTFESVEPFFNKTADGSVDVNSGEQNGLPAPAEKGVHLKLKETMRLFNKHYLHFVQEEETRCAKLQEDEKALKGSKSKHKKRNGTDDDAKNISKRPDLKAMGKIIETNSVLYPEKRIGDLPGINVGHQFYSRVEMVVVGFHSHWLNGIDYMGLDYRKRESKYTLPLAVSIVLSGMYEDDLDNADEVIYTGQGGHNLTGDKHQIGDQVLARGNLALKNCIDQCVPVRVVRGHKSTNSYSGKVYTYDGLYKVVQYWAEKGLSGFTVFKYRLKRFEGQPILTTNQVHFTNGRVPQSVSEIRGLVCEDISGGQEKFPIPARNLVDNPAAPPTGFVYCKSIEVSKNVKLPTNATGCNCKGTCVDPRTCSCAKLNGPDFPYVHTGGGRLVQAKDVVFECGPKCQCGPGCVNRTSQGGLKYRFEVFRTPRKGWAVRSWDFIPSGAPVCEYVGVLMRTEDVENDSDSNYIFDIDCLQTMRGLGGRERRLMSIPEIEKFDGPDNQKLESVPEFCIDAGSKGNIARFINHSCEPNLFVQCVLSSHQDIKLARIMLFAADNIPALQELTYDYGYVLDSVYGPDGKVKQMPCFCGAAECRKRLF